jgi:hypothetical protein
MADTDNSFGTVHRLLVTGDDDKLRPFDLAVFRLLNFIERREQTVFYTCMECDHSLALTVARNVGVTVQEIHDAGEDETYETLVDNGPGWQAKGRRSVVI